MLTANLKFRATKILFFFLSLQCFTLNNVTILILKANI
jgi:hypothetical protein